MNETTAGGGPMGNLTMNSLRESKQLLAEEVFHHIGAQIVEGVLAPGQRIRDLDVAEELHVSRTPVREALQRLERLGMVTMYPSRYTEVTIVTPEVVAQSLEFAGLQAGASARLAVPRLTTPQRQHVAALADRLPAAIEDSVRTTNLRWAIFSYLGDHSGNSHHRTVIEEATMVLLRNLRGWPVPADDREDMRQIYRDFREAVLQGDGVEAERLTRAMHYL